MDTRLEYYSNYHGRWLLYTSKDRFVKDEDIIARVFITRPDGKYLAMLLNSTVVVTVKDNVIMHGTKVIHNLEVLWMDHRKWTS